MYAWPYGPLLIYLRRPCPDPVWQRSRSRVDDPNTSRRRASKLLPGMEPLDWCGWAGAGTPAATHILRMAVVGRLDGGDGTVAGEPGSRKPRRLRGGRLGGCRTLPGFPPGIAVGTALTGETPDRGGDRPYGRPPAQIPARGGISARAPSSGSGGKAHIGKGMLHAGGW
jgi:hypothetical protein